MNLQEILEKFSIISSLSWEEISQWASICEDACEEIRNNLKENIDENMHSKRLNTAAATLAFYKYVLYRASSGAMESFTAGEIRIKTNPELNVRIAHNAWKNAKNSISDLLKDNNFMFERIT